MKYIQTLLEIIFSKLKTVIDRENYTVVLFDYDPEINFILEFDFDLSSGWGSVSKKMVEGVQVYNYEKTRFHLVILRVRFQYRDKWKRYGKPSQLPKESPPDDDIELNEANES